MIKSLSNRLKSIPGVSRYAEEYTKLDRVGEGTFGEVHKAVRQSTKELVALKKIRMEVCDKEGRWERTDFPFTAVREIKLLKQLKHPNIISVIDMAVEAFGPHQNDKPEIYLVFPYMEGDLCGILDDPRVILDMGTIKAYMQQLLDGLHYLHYNNIIHRDLKSANILLNNRGELRIADFGLARQYEPVRRPEMTAVVVTRWYRAPELLLGMRRYTIAIDMWAFGCILAEMITRKPLFPGQDQSSGKNEVTGEIGQLKLIYEYCGAPTNSDLDEIMQGERELREAAKMVDRVPFFASRSLIQHLRAEFTKSSTKAERLEDRDNLIQLIDALLVHIPTRRPGAHECLKHAFFTKGVPVTELYRIRPLPGDIHEVDARRRNGALGPVDAPAPRAASPPRNVNGPFQPLPPHQPPPHYGGHHSNPYASHGAPQRASGHPVGMMPAHAHGASSSGYRGAGDTYRDTRDRDRDREYHRRSRSPADHHAYYPRSTGRLSPPPPPPPPHVPQSAGMRSRGTSAHAPPPSRGYSRDRGGYDGQGYHGGYGDRGPRGSARDRAPSTDGRAGPGGQGGPNLSLPPTPAALPTPPRPPPSSAAHAPESISGLFDKYGMQPPSSGSAAPGIGMARDVGRSTGGAGASGGGYPSHGPPRSRISSASDSRPLSATRPGSASHPSLPSKPPLPPLPSGGGGGGGGGGTASARTSADRVPVGVPPRNIGLPRAPSVTMTTSVSGGDGVWSGVGGAHGGGPSERERDMPSSTLAAPHANGAAGGPPDRLHRDRPNPWASAVGVGANARRG